MWLPVVWFMSSSPSVSVGSIHRLNLRVQTKPTLCVYRALLTPPPKKRDTDNAQTFVESLAPLTQDGHHDYKQGERDCRDVGTFKHQRAVFLGPALHKMDAVCRTGGAGMLCWSQVRGLHT